MVFLACALLLPSFAFSESLDGYNFRNAAKIGVSKISAYNESNVLTITYTGTSTQAVIGITATAITAAAPIGTADTSFGTTGSYDITAAAYDTLGELCDAINLTASYKCVLNGGKRDDASVIMQLVTASASTDAKSAGGYSAKFSTGTATATNTDPYIVRVGITPLKDRSVVLKKCIVTNAGTGTLLVYGKLRKYALSASDGITRNDTTLVWTEATANGVALTETWEGSFGGGLEFDRDAHVVISAGNVATTQIAADNVKCYWDEK